MNNNIKDKIKKRFDYLLREYCGGLYCNKDTCENCSWIGKIGEIYNIIDEEINND